MLKENYNSRVSEQVSRIKKKHNFNMQKMYKEVHKIFNNAK